ncbi:unnamed protein product [Vitrella brassicaformis CCMP3155]|uniref:CBM20 domain-containing protein n=2 Tax=Vitrella brassicaformis TaxID=1169539 RepID=A0A0G4H7E9_VITBC|nr:unnamed protein product [Vitrella brassicaformis CCMP3155]|eukprot:CEM39831.1 unnamed protein product [Vitrella brassicaformis CCMP3155]
MNGHSEGEAEPAVIPVCFKVKAYTKPGEQLRVVGNHPALGYWDFLQAVDMRTNEVSFPVWESLPVQITAVQDRETVVEYKYIICRDRDHHWEDHEYGHHRTVTLPPIQSLHVVMQPQQQQQQHHQQLTHRANAPPPSLTPRTHHSSCGSEREAGGKGAFIAEASVSMESTAAGTPRLEGEGGGGGGSGVPVVDVKYALCICDDSFGDWRRAPTLSLINRHIALSEMVVHFQAGETQTDSSTTHLNPEILHFYSNPIMLPEDDPRRWAKAVTMPARPDDVDGEEESEESYGYSEEGFVCHLKGVGVGEHVSDRELFEYVPGLAASMPLLETMIDRFIDDDL